MGKKRKKKNYRFRDDCFYIGPLKEEEDEGVCLIFGSFVVTHHTSLYRIQMSKPHRRRRRKKILKEACHFDPMHFTLRIKFDFFFYPFLLFLCETFPSQRFAPAFVIIVYISRRQWFNGFSFALTVSPPRPWLAVLLLPPTLSMFTQDPRGSDLYLIITKKVTHPLDFLPYRLIEPTRCTRWSFSTSWNSKTKKVPVVQYNSISRTSDYPAIRSDKRKLFFFFNGHH
jgi:hypothetical protein